MRVRLPGLGVVWDAARAGARRFPEALVASLATGMLVILRIDDVLPDGALVYRSIGTLGLGIPIAFALACGGERRGWGPWTRVVAMLGFGLVLAGWTLVAPISGGTSSCTPRVAEPRSRRPRRGAQPEPFPSPRWTVTATPFSRSHAKRACTAAKLAALTVGETTTSSRAPGPARRAACAIVSASYGVSQVVCSSVPSRPSAGMMRVRTNEGR